MSRGRPETQKAYRKRYYEEHKQAEHARVTRWKRMCAAARKQRLQESNHA